MSAMLQEIPLEHPLQVCTYLKGEDANAFKRFMDEEHLRTPAEAARKLILDQLSQREEAKGVQARHKRKG